MFHTELCDIFDADFPIMNAGMNKVAYGDMAGAVSASGGIGVIGATDLTPKGLQNEIDTAREWAPEGPLAVDIVFPHRAPSREDEIPSPEEIPRPIEQLRSELEEKAGDVQSYEETELHAFNKERSEELLEVALDNQVDAIASAVGTPEWVVEEVHDAGAKVISLVGHPKHAVYADELGVDIIVADGTQGGGHSGYIATMNLVPMVKEVVHQPVVASGGITTGAQILAALSLGAVGVWCGTLFVPTKESMADPAHKRAILSADDPDPTVHSKAIDGYPTRVLKNRLTEVYDEFDEDPMDYPEQHVMMKPIRDTADIHDVDEYKTMSAGQGTPLIEDTGKFPQVNYVMAQLLDELDAAWDALSGMHTDEF